MRCVVLYGRKYEIRESCLLLVKGKRGVAMRSVLVLMIQIVCSVSAAVARPCYWKHE